MNDADYLKCSCQNCGGHIEFPPSGAGESVTCPHCSWQTKLDSTSEKSPVKPGGKPFIFAAAILLVPLLIAAGVIGYWSMLRKPAIAPASLATPAITNSAIPDAFTQLNDFKISKITLKKAEGGGLVYAIGTVKNDTPRQRFGVKIELDLLDAQDNKIGSATDYLEVLEPQKEWQFRALLTEPKAVKATLKGIEEQK